MDLVDYIDIIFDTLKNIFIGLLSIALIGGLFYGANVLYSKIDEINPLLCIMPLIFFIAFKLGKFVRNTK
jgi:hypothetical protein